MKEKGCGSDRCIADQACAMLIDDNTTTDTHYSAGSSSGCGGLLDARLESAAEQGWQHKQRALLPSHTRPVANCACSLLTSLVVFRVSRKRSRWTVCDRDYIVTATATNNATKSMHELELRARFGAFLEGNLHRRAVTKIAPLENLCSGVDWWRDPVRIYFVVELHLCREDVLC